MADKISEYQGAAVSSPPSSVISAAGKPPPLIELQFFNPYGEVKQSENRMPHWQQSGAVYFVTFRLDDAIPVKLRDDFEQERAAWMRINPLPWTPEIELKYHRRFSGKVEQWLDAGYGSCILRSRNCGAIVDEALSHFESERVVRLSSVVMPNHVHVLFVQHPDEAVDKLLRSWKSYTTRQINTQVGRAGTLWQKDYFDRLVRDEQHFANCVRYIRRNPEKARLAATEFILFENELAKNVDG